MVDWPGKMESVMLRRVESRDAVGGRSGKSGSHGFVGKSPIPRSVQQALRSACRRSRGFNNGAEEIL